MLPVTNLLVDFENLKPSPEEIALVRGDHYRLWIFHGPHQNKFDASMVRAWQPLGERVDFVQSARQGKNALDFHIAFKLGALWQGRSATGLAANYIVVTGDGGFEALFEHMRTLACTVGKAASIPEALAVADSWRPNQPAATTASRPSRGIIPAAKPVSQKASPTTAAVGLRKTVAAGDVPTIVAALRAHPKNRPGDRKALERYVVAGLGNKVAPGVARAVVDQLEHQKVVRIAQTGLEYRIPTAKSTK